MAPGDSLAPALSRLGASATTVLIDGRSGSGKSTLARDLSRRWRGSILVRLDHVYPGWDGLAWAVDHVRVELLEPRSAGRPGRWRSWSWVRNAPGVWHTVAPDQRIVVEGVGALTPLTRPLADLTVWVDADDAERKERALLRDGDAYAPHWDRWAAQEVDFIARHDPRGQADLIARYDDHVCSLTPAEEAP